MVGLDPPTIVALAQLIVNVAYQARVVAGLQAMTSLPATPSAQQSSESEATIFMHPSSLPKAGEPVRMNGLTSETLDLQAELPVLKLDVATPARLAVLDASHSKARSSDCYRLLAHQPHILHERSAAFNAVIGAPGGLSRAERKLAGAAASRLNGCAYCAAVHAQRSEQLAKRNDAILQLFTAPVTLGTTAREWGVVQVAIAQT